MQDALQPSALTGRPPLGSFPPCLLSFNEQEDVRWAQELLPTSNLGPSAHCDPHLAPPSCAAREHLGQALFLAYTTRLSLLLAPTGTRPEHITDLLNVPRRIHANKIHAALSALFCRISAGTLPPAARWLTRTRLCWQRKKNGKPRPIKMGEFLRSAYAKRLVNLSQVHLRTKTLRMHQWGVNLPGACEALCHWRGTIEPLVLNGTLEPLVAADLDLMNMFGNAEWPHIRAALRTHFPEASSWTEWQHQSDSVTTLPSGRAFSTDRGAEQGDVLGTIQSAPVLGDARETHLQDFLSTPFEQKGVCDEWFVDDGQCFVRPMLFDRWLRALGLCLGLLWRHTGAALPSAMPGALPGSYAHPSDFTSSVVGTPPMFVTLSSSSVLTQARPLWARPSAPVSKSTPGLGSQCAPVTNCALPSTEWTTHPLNSS